MYIVIWEMCIMISYMCIVISIMDKMISEIAKTRSFYNIQQITIHIQQNALHIQQIAILIALIAILTWLIIALSSFTQPAIGMSHVFQLFPYIREAQVLVQLLHILSAKKPYQQPVQDHKCITKMLYQSGRSPMQLLFF